MRIKHTVNPRIAEDADMENLLFGLNDVLAEITVDAYVRVISGKASVAESANEDLSLGDITAVKGFFLIADAECIIKLNGSSDEIQLRIGGTGTTNAKAKFFIEADSMCC